MTPPYPNWKSYAPTFKEYAQNHIRNTTKAVFNNEYLPDRDQLQKWLATASNSFKSMPNDRPRNTIIALMLRPVFKESINSWDTLRFLGQASISPPTSLTDLNVNSDFEFNRWEKAVPEQLKEVVQRIGFLFSKIG
jgi:preprotein translocase subunit Sec63